MNTDGARALNGLKKLNELNGEQKASEKSARPAQILRYSSKDFTGGNRANGGAEK